MLKIINCISESANLCILLQESDDPELRKAGRRIIKLLEEALDRVVEIKHELDKK